MLPARLVLIHGFTQTRASWDEIGRHFTSRGLEVVTVDLPGHGAAAAITADLLGSAALIGEAGGPAVYVGYSLGGRVALHLALARPDLVQRLVVVGATGGLDDASERARRRLADEALATELESAGDAGVPAFIDRWLNGPLFASLSRDAAGIEARLTNTAAGLASSLRLAGTGTQDPLWERLSTLEMPVLVMAGERDEKFITAGHRLVAAIGANASLAVVAGAGHALHLEQPDVFVETVAGFVEGAN